MSLFARLLQAVRSWRRRRGGPKTVRYAGIAMEQLDHRQLLSVNFTGNVPTDFPATQSPGVVVLPDNPSVVHPTLGPTLAPIVKVSGFDISGIRVSYSPFDDTLSIGLDQPQSLNHPGEVIAGDADNNGNSATVNPIISGNNGGIPPSGLVPAFQDLPNYSGTEYMGVFLDFTGSGSAQIVAGFNPAFLPATPTDPHPLKPYEVALAIPAAAPAPQGFGAELPQFEGNVYSNNSIAHPNLEFSIKDFSQLYKQETGKTLTASSVFYIGAQAGSDQDQPITEAFFPEQLVNVGAATLPNSCPPASPPILINPHEHRGIDTSHRDLVRVYVQGTSGFDVTTINPATVSLDGASPIAHFTRHFPHSEFPVATYVFVGSDIHLPAGYTTATFAAQTFSGQQITTSKQVLNIPFSAKVPGRLHFLMDKDSAYPALHRLEATQPGAVTLGNTTQPLAASVKVNLTSRAAIQNLRVSYRDQVSTTGTTTPVALPRTVVSLAARRQGGA
ncbi:MAG: hypothetical protein ACXWNX_17175 [Isosphaeraceae bacterium]